MSNDEYQHQTFCNYIKSMKKEQAINALIKEADASLISDGYHTFKELYDHRNILFVILSKMIKSENARHVWRSIKHSDGTVNKGWFIMGINKEAGTQITYHLPIELWDVTGYAETLDKAPDFDNHNSTAVIERLKTLLILQVLRELQFHKKKI